MLLSKTNDNLIKKVQGKGFEPHFNIKKYDFLLLDKKDNFIRNLLF
jgi:hypothetical protein